MCWCRGKNYKLEINCVCVFVCPAGHTIKATRFLVHSLNVNHNNHLNDKAEDRSVMVNGRGCVGISGRYMSSLQANVVQANIACC